MNYQQATDLIRSHTDYGGSVDVHALAVAMSEDAPAFGQTDAEALHDAWQSTFAHMDAVAVEPKLTVWYGSMPESNGKTNWTAILHNGDVSKGITVDRSEYPERVRYEADRMRWMIGELDKEPWISDYDTDKHSGYTATSSDWAPARIWLQREQGEGGSHTWCEDSVGDGDMIEEAEYMRIYTAPPAASGQKLTYEQINEVWKSANGTYLDRNEFGAMVVDFARALLAASDSQGGAA